MAMADRILLYSHFFFFSLLLVDVNVWYTRASGKPINVVFKLYEIKKNAQNTSGKNMSNSYSNIATTEMIGTDGFRDFRFTRIAFIRQDMPEQYTK